MSPLLHGLVVVMLGCVVSLIFLIAVIVYYIYQDRKQRHQESNADSSTAELLNNLAEEIQNHFDKK